MNSEEDNFNRVLLAIDSKLDDFKKEFTHRTVDIVEKTVADRFDKIQRDLKVGPHGQSNSSRSRSETREEDAIAAQEEDRGPGFASAKIDDCATDKVVDYQGDSQ